MTPPPTPVARAKDLAKLLRSDLAAAGIDVPHSLALELIAHQHGARDWNTLAATAGAHTAAAPAPVQPPAQAPAFAPGVPVLRVMSAEVALGFYRDYLGFTLDWEHRFEAGFPLYVQVSRGQMVLHLSEHHGDGSPHGVVWIAVADVHALHTELHSHSAAPLRPGVDLEFPGGPTMEVIDPYGNVLRFCQPDGS
ncbi:glyoxalase superfamily protein [Kineococcus radiotolerans]|uniref:Bleomycin resistance protein n=1 Tax=Kineococcus radiotolerans (strain ATCC BAA-149 / DSM 14245 / SRS30216) TaxID=266940 RepID=A6WA87_KINRD|nr:glyoxalase superfamily protein [Kineococcus radiotolerans]ABS03726.1 Glyoxalase/bleomycin resistance protein/dioxygenase [Kineococcus radiotolerans SRS30216 = ATCC BAA-149]